MNITFDKKFAPQFYDIIIEKSRNDICPFCNLKVKKKDFAGCIKINGEMRMLHGNLTCLIGLSDYQRKVNEREKCERFSNFMVRSVFIASLIIITVICVLTILTIK